MCDTNRRCDRPSCPCNEPDTELKDALTRMQERFPKPWTTAIEPKGRDSFWAIASRHHAEGAGDTETYGYGPTPHAAVDAAINAWDAAVKADALYILLGEARPEQLAALNTLSDAYDELRKHNAVLKAECEAWRAQDAAYAEWMRREDLVYNSRPDMFAYRVEACQEHGDTLKAARAARAETDKAGALNG